MSMEVPVLLPLALLSAPATLTGIFVFTWIRPVGRKKHETCVEAPKLGKFPQNKSQFMGFFPGCLKGTWLFYLTLLKGRAPTPGQWKHTHQQFPGKSSGMTCLVELVSSVLSSAPMNKHLPTNSSGWVIFHQSPPNQKTRWNTAFLQRAKTRPVFPKTTGYLPIFFAVTSCCKPL